MNIKKAATKTIDLSELFGKQHRQDDRIFSKTVVNVHEFYLCGEVEPAEEYIQWFDTIRHAGSTDIIKIYINSYGGDVFAAVQLMRALQESQASVVVSVEGACMSVATMIFLCADSFEVSDHSMFMFHNYSGGTFGKGGEMLDQIQHEKKWADRMLTEIYEDFLTDAEIKSLQDNKDIWMDGDEVIKRLQSRKTLMEGDEEAEQAEEQQLPAPKLPRPRKNTKERVNI